MDSWISQQQQLFPLSLIPPKYLSVYLKTQLVWTLASADRSWGFCLPVQIHQAFLSFWNPVSTWCRPVQGPPHTVVSLYTAQLYRATCSSWSPGSAQQSRPTHTFAPSCPPTKAPPPTSVCSKLSWFKVVRVPRRALTVACKSTMTHNVFSYQQPCVTSSYFN